MQNLNFLSPLTVQKDHTKQCPELTLCLLGNSCFCLLLTFFKINFLKKKFRNTIRVSNSLDSDQARRYVGPDLGPICLQRLSADDKRKERFKGLFPLFLQFEHHLLGFCSFQLGSPLCRGIFGTEILNGSWCCIIFVSIL